MDWMQSPNLHCLRERSGLGALYQGENVLASLPFQKRSTLSTSTPFYTKVVNVQPSTVCVQVFYGFPNQVTGCLGDTHMYSLEVTFESQEDRYLADIFARKGETFVDMMEWRALEIRLMGTNSRP